MQGELQFHRQLGLSLVLYQRNPFKIILSNAPADITYYQLTLEWNNSSGLDYRPITVLSQQIRDNFGVEIFGEVRNDQSEEMQSGEVVVSFYDSLDEVINVDFGFPNLTTLAPGETSSYSIKTFDEDLTFSSMTVQAEGYLSP